MTLEEYDKALGTFLFVAVFDTLFLVVAATILVLSC